MRLLASISNLQQKLCEVDVPDEPFPVFFLVAAEIDDFDLNADMFRSSATLYHCLLDGSRDSSPSTLRCLFSMPLWSVRIPTAKVWPWPEFSRSETAIQSSVTATSLLSCFSVSATRSAIKITDLQFADAPPNVVLMDGGGMNHLQPHSGCQNHLCQSY